MGVSLLARVGACGLLVFGAACSGGGGSSGIGLEDLKPDGQIVILCFGDSITAGVGDGIPVDQPPPNPAGYPKRLPPLLMRKTKLQLVVIDDGNPGERTRDGLVRLRRDLQIANPDYTILLEGTNDVEAGLADQAIANMQAMIDSVFQAGGMPLLGTITPSCCNHQNILPEPAILFYNDQMRAMAKNNSVTLVDFYSDFAGGPEMSYDPNRELIIQPEGLHPTPAGYDVMAVTASKIF